MIGPPGCGKTTLGKKFAFDHDYDYISSGDAARKIAERDEGAYASLMAGGYAPEQQIRSYILTEIDKVENAGRRFVLDGFPRTLAQYILLEQSLQADVHYVSIKAPRYTCVHRLIERNRDHDTADAIAARLESFERDTRPMMGVMLNLTFLSGLGPQDSLVSELVDIAGKL